jgi:hypothetical protein
MFGLKFWVLFLFFLFSFSGREFCGFVKGEHHL